MLCLNFVHFYPGGQHLYKNWLADTLGVNKCHAILHNCRIEYKNDAHNLPLNAACHSCHKLFSDILQYSWYIR